MGVEKVKLLVKCYVGDFITCICDIILSLMVKLTVSVVVRSFLGDKCKEIVDVVYASSCLFSASS